MERQCGTCEHYGREANVGDFACLYPLPFWVQGSLMIGAHYTTRGQGRECKMWKQRIEA